MKSKEGVLVIYVPQSEGGPHRAKGATSSVNDLYFTRTDCDTVRMQHAHLASMFGRSPPPILQLTACVASGSYSGLSTAPTSISFSFTLNIRNIGRGYAQQPSIHLESVEIFDSLNLMHVTRFPAQGWSSSQMQLQGGRSSRVVLRSDANSIIYPGEEIPVFTGVTHLLQVKAGQIFRLKGTIYAMGTRPIEFDSQKEYQSYPFHWEASLPLVQETTSDA